LYSNVRLLNEKTDSEDGISAVVQPGKCFHNSKIVISLLDFYLLETLLVTWLGGPQKCQKLKDFFARQTQKEEIHAKREFGINYIV